jgi:hypothetical protein
MSHYDPHGRPIHHSMPHPAPFGALTPEERQERQAANRAARQARQAENRAAREAKKAERQAAQQAAREERQAGAPARRAIQQERNAEAAAAAQDFLSTFVTSMIPTGTQAPAQAGAPTSFLPSSAAPSGAVPSGDAGANLWQSLAQGVASLAQTGIASAQTAAMQQLQAAPPATQAGVNKVLTGANAAAAAYGLPTLAVSPKPGPWSAPGSWKTDALKKVYAAGLQILPRVLASPKGYAAQVQAMLDALAQAKRNIEQAKAQGVINSPTASRDLSRLSERWYEAASGLLRGAVYVSSGKNVESLGAADVYVLNLAGMRFTGTGVAFAAAGGANYARVLSQDTAALLRAMPTATEPTPAPTGPRAIIRVPAQVADVVTTPREDSGGMLMAVGALGLLGLGAVFLKGKAPKKKK